MGATDSNDGQSTYAWPSNVSNVPVELIERNSPLFVHRKELRSGSGGAGRFRGGLGQEIEFEVISETPIGVIFMAERCRFPAPGMRGGRAGARGEVRIDGQSRLPQERGADEGPARAAEDARRWRHGRPAGARCRTPPNKTARRATAARESRKPDVPFKTPGWAPRSAQGRGDQWAIATDVWATAPALGGSAGEIRGCHLHGPPPMQNAPAVSKEREIIPPTGRLIMGPLIAILA